MDLIGSAVLGKNNSNGCDNDNSNNGGDDNCNDSSTNRSNGISNGSSTMSSTQNSDIMSTTQNFDIMSSIQSSEDNKNIGLLKSEPMPLIDELSTASPSSSTVEQTSSTPESRNRITTSPGGNSRPITDPTSTNMEKAERPSLSYKDLIIEAIESSPEKRLKLNEIYQVCYLFLSFCVYFVKWKK